MRHQLRSLSAFVQTCKSRAALFDYLGPHSSNRPEGRDHLAMLSVDVYSLQDLLDINNSTLARFLVTVLEKWIVHVKVQFSLLKSPRIGARPAEARATSASTATRRN